MGTRSTISIEAPNGEITSIYCHWDGYIDGVGKTLFAHYQDITKIRELIALGNISSLGKEVGEKHLFDMDYQTLTNLGWTNAYHRDRGEPFEQDKFASRQELHDHRQEYNYLYSEKKKCWYYKRSDGQKFVKLTEKSRDR